MSQTYQMDVFLKNVDARKVGDVAKLAGAEWPFGEWNHDHRAGQDDGLIDLDARGVGSLAGGEEPDEFADRLALAVWAANGGYCAVEVYSTYMEDLPQDQHKRGRREFRRLSRQAKSR